MEHFCTVSYTPHPSKKSVLVKTDTLLDLPPVLKGTEAKRSQRQETASNLSLIDMGCALCEITVGSFVLLYFLAHIFFLNNDVKEDLWEVHWQIRSTLFLQDHRKVQLSLYMWTQRIKHIGKCHRPHVLHLYKNTKIFTIIFFLTSEFIKSVCRWRWQTEVSKTNLMKSVSKGFFCDFNISSGCVSSVRLTHWEGCTFFPPFPCLRRNTLCMF